MTRGKHHQGGPTAWEAKAWGTPGAHTIHKDWEQCVKGSRKWRDELQVIPVQGQQSLKAALRFLCPGLESVLPPGPVCPSLMALSWAGLADSEQSCRAEGWEGRGGEAKGNPALANWEFLGSLSDYWGLEQHWYQGGVAALDPLRVTRQFFKLEIHNYFGFIQKCNVFNSFPVLD